MPGGDEERRDGFPPTSERLRRKRRAAASPHVFLDMLPDLPDAGRDPPSRSQIKPIRGIKAPRARTDGKRAAIAPPRDDQTPVAQDEPANLFEAVSLAQMQFCARGLLAWSRVCAATLGKS